MPQSQLDRLRTRVGQLVRKQRDRFRDPEIKALLAFEAAKVRDLDLTVAIAGTVKAGKSTIINTLIGVELLPVGNRPTTMLPTRIRHEVGRTAPVLVVPDHEPYTAAIALLRRYEPELPEAAKAEITAVLQQAGQLRLGPEHRTFSGTGAIYEVLWVLNELTRWCVQLGLTSPLEHLHTPEDLPLISIEFRHLRSRFAGRSRGRFTLVDTPGPNEAGQTVLHNVLRTQLEHASAVLGVLDYTQLGSQADALLREEFLSAARRMPGRVWILVNKFDQQAAHSEDAAAVRRRVAHGLLKRQISSSHVFPVAARLAYLALRALDDPDLPGPEREEFAQIAFGTLWEDRIGDAAQVKRAAVRIWESSRFQEPLWQAMGPLFQNRVWYVLQHALERVSQVATIPATLAARVQAALAKAPTARTVPTVPWLRRRAVALGTGAVAMRGIHVELVGRDPVRWLTLLRRPDRVHLWVAPGKGKRMAARYVPAAALTSDGDLDMLAFSPRDLAQMPTEAIDALLRESLESRLAGT